MMGREEEYIRRMRELGYEPSLAGMDDEDIEWELAKIEEAERRREAEQQPVRTVYRPVDPGLKARILRQMGQPYDPQAIDPQEAYYIGGWENGKDEDAKGNARDKMAASGVAKKRVKNVMGDADDQEEGRYSVFFSRDDQSFYLLDNNDGSLVKSWEGRSGFVPGVNEKGEPYESLPLGTYTVTAEVSKNGFADKNGRSDPAYGTFYITSGDPRGRDIHGGGSGLANPFAPRQGWADTQGCLRMQNQDGEELCGYIMRQGKAKMHVVQGPVSFGPFEASGEDDKARTDEEEYSYAMFPGFTSPGPY